MENIQDAFLAGGSNDCWPCVSTVVVFLDFMIIQDEVNAEVQKTAVPQVFEASCKSWGIPIRFCVEKSILRVKFKVYRLVQKAEAY